MNKLLALLVMSCISLLGVQDITVNVQYTCFRCHKAIERPSELFNDIVLCDQCALEFEEQYNEFLLRFFIEDPAILT